MKSKKQKLTVIYVHGLGKTCETSKKYHAIKNFFNNEDTNVIGFDWEQSDDLFPKIKNFISSNVKIKNNILVIGSSAGGKVALAFKDIFEEYFNTFVMVALLNPLTNELHRSKNNPNLLTNEYLKYGDLHLRLNEALIVYSTGDEMIDQVKNVLEMPKRNKYVNVGRDNHGLSNSTGIALNEIEIYMNSFV